MLDVAADHDVLAGVLAGVPVDGLAAEHRIAFRTQNL